LIDLKNQNLEVELHALDLFVAAGDLMSELSDAVDLPLFGREDCLN